MDEGVDSSVDLDLLNESPIQTEETRATGHFGEDPGIQQAPNLHSRGASTPSGLGQVPWGLHGKDNEARMKNPTMLHERHNTCLKLPMQASKKSSYLDDEALGRDLTINPLDMPQFETADRLVRAYMESVHNSFPFLQKKAFLDCFYDCMLAHLLRTATRDCFIQLNQSYL